jgi:hypothetical protein
MTPQTALSAVWTAPSAHPGMKETSSPARKMPRSAGGSPSCMKCRYMRWLYRYWPGSAPLKAPRKFGSFSQETVTGSPTMWLAMSTPG